jgi:hypothetical protein
MLGAQGGRGRKGWVGLGVMLCRPLRGRCRRAWHKIFLDGLGIEVWGAAEEASINGFDKGGDRQVAKTLVHEFYSICFGGSVTQEQCKFWWWHKGGRWGTTFTGAGS